MSLPFAIYTYDRSRERMELVAKFSYPGDAYLYLDRVSAAPCHEYSEMRQKNTAPIARGHKPLALELQELDLIDG